MRKFLSLSGFAQSSGPPQMHHALVCQAQSTSHKQKPQQPLCSCITACTLHSLVPFMLPFMLCGGVQRRLDGAH